GSWIQVASHTVIDPNWRSEQMSQPHTVTPELRQEILTAREAVWRAWFGNDRPALERLIPEDLIAINAGAGEWSNRSATLAEAQRFADHGGKLLSLEFPKTEIQIYGNTVIVYSSYQYEIELDGKHEKVSGRSTETFVYRGNQLVNPGWHLDSGK
ncbi:MAG: nuclear transport factor 2 family protein, partial [Blastocatellia bacterium]|nr:nuclear transport factor 2 family protein [Blastocatellia bacterium]